MNIIESNKYNQNNINYILNNFISEKKIPNIIIYGENGVGKKSILFNFLKNIYKKEENINKYILVIDCIFGKGIQFIRDELTFFLKTVIKKDNNSYFKSVVLLNADYLTIDAQSALRRLIELYSYNTRFFIIVKNLNGIINPILSRFCSFYIHYPIINDIEKNLHNIQKNSIPKSYYQNRLKLIQRWLDKLKKNKDFNNKILIEITDKLYLKGCSALDIINYIKQYCNNDKTNDLIFYFEKIRIHLKQEKILILFILYKYYNIINK